MFYVKTLAEKRKDVKKAATNFVFLLWKVQFSYIWCHYSLNFCIKTQLKFLQNQISSEDISLFYAKSLIIFMELVVEKFDFWFLQILVNLWSPYTCKLCPEKNSIHKMHNRISAKNIFCF